MESTQTRTYLAVPHDEKDEARKAAGKLENNKSALRFDDERKVWYALPGANMEALKRWKPDPLLTGVSAGDALTQFIDFLRANGADVPEKVIMDGTRQRIRMKDDKPGKKSCTYVGHLDGLPNGWFNDFRDGGKDDLNTWYFSGEEGDPVAALHMKAVTAQGQWDRAEAKRILQDKKAGNVRYVHGKFGQAGHQHPYLVKKGVQAARGVHIDGKQRLLIPLQNVDGVIRSMQTIDTEGNKRLTKDAEKSGNFFVVGGTLKNGRPIVCAEGYATAASGAMALRMPVVMAIDSGNLVKVAENLHKKYPDSPMLFLGDDDPPKPHRPGNPGKEAAEKAARLTGGIAVLPALTPEEKAQGMTDFNDLHQSRGLAALTEELAPLRQTLLPEPTPDASPELQPTETVIMNEPDNVNNEPAAPVASEAAAPETLAPQTLSPDSAAETSAKAPVKKARRAKKATPADAKEKGSTKPAAAPKKPRQKKNTTEDKQEKPQQAAPAETESQNNSGADPTPSLSSLLKQESPAVSTPPAPEDEEAQPVIPPVNEAVPPLRKDAPSGTDEHGTHDSDAPVSDAMPEPDGIRFERSLQARERIDLVALEGALLHKPGNERGTQQYLLDGERAFTRYLQQGRIIMATPQASQNDRMILGALLVAKQDMVLQGNIELTGSPAFKQRAINLIAEYDLPLKLTSPEQIKMLEETREKLRSEPALPDEPTPLGSEASEILVHPAATHASPQPGEAPASAAPASAATARNTATAPLPPDILPQRSPAPVPMNASHDEASAGLTGTLLEHGPAPYNFQKDESHSYYARLRTAEGERVVWGIALRAAISDAGLQNNDLVTLQMTGKETVTVDVKQKGPDGKPMVDEKGRPVYRKEERERNKWTARQAIDPGVVNADTRTMTPPGELLAYSLKDWHNLQAGVEELATKAGVSLPDWPGLPDALWMEQAGKGVPTPDRKPDNPMIPSPSRDAGKALFQAMDAEERLKLLLVKAHGDYVQGVVLHEDVYKPVLGKLCKNARGAPHMTLNEITPDGLKPLGYGNPINNDTGSFNDYVFRLNNEPRRLYAQGLEPEKRPAALQQQLGFDSAPVAPDQLVVRREQEPTHRHTPTMPRPGR
ncbi:DUF5710 domain-containing protein [Salmonella enterica]|nr:DUF5710 domain-containing protein [Salmonella enterica]MDJ7048066.1 DUF5710 domain-containing protein [Salmonella enterica]MDJ7338307.1 DUF5710 domain-containing protein [Salmonella enterica]